MALLELPDSIGRNEDVPLFVPAPARAGRVRGKGTALNRKERSFIIGMGLTAFLGMAAMPLARLPGLALMGSLTVALLLGIGWRSAFGLPVAETGGIEFSAKRLLRYGIILTGVRLNFGLIAAAGIGVLSLSLILIAFGVVFIPWLGRKMGLSPNLSLMLGVGQSICGASAISAVAAVTPDVKDEEVSLAVSICGLLGTLGVIFFNLSAVLLGWNGSFYGLLSGSTLHEVAQVLAAGPAGGPIGDELAMVVKLTRVTLLAPVVCLIAFLFTTGRASKPSPGGFSWTVLPMPWFVFGFLAVGALNSLGLLPAEVARFALQISIFLMVMAMAAMGLMVDMAVIRKTGLKALGVAGGAFCIFGAASFLLIVYLLPALK